MSPVCVPLLGCAETPPPTILWCGKRHLASLFPGKGVEALLRDRIRYTGLSPNENKGTPGRNSRRLLLEPGRDFGLGVNRIFGCQHKSEVRTTPESSGTE